MEKKKNVPPEDPNAVAKRDRVERTGKPGARKRTGVRYNPADRAAAVGSARSARGLAYEIGGSRMPPGVGVVYHNGKAYGHRFTDRQWAALALTYGGFSGPRSVAYVARRLGFEKKQIQQDLDAAEVMARHLVYEWMPAARKWSRIKAGNPYDEELTKREKQWLDVHRRTDRKKKGRAPVYGYGSGEVRSRKPEVPSG